MTFSNRTLTPISGANVMEAQICDFAHDNGATPVYRLSNDESNGVPKTSLDMSKLYEWVHGQTLYGTEAKENAAMQEYIKDINEAYGNESKYNNNMIFINTEKLVSEQLEEIKS